MNNQNEKRASLFLDCVKTPVISLFFSEKIDSFLTSLKVAFLVIFEHETDPS